MKKICSFIIALSFTQNLNAQILSIKDKVSGGPLEMVTITSEKPRVFTTTNANGEADISSFKGAEKIEIRSLAYKSEVTSYNELLKNNFLILLSPAKFNLDEIVISATRWIDNAAEVSSKIRTINTQDILFQNPQTSADMLAITGKVFIQKSQQGGGSPMIRGFATNRLIYTIDGVRMNNAIFRAGNIQNVISLDAFSMQKSEVCFGPGSVIYGSDAIGGVMSFQTLNPQFSFKDEPFVSGKAVSRYSSANNEKTAHFDVNIGWKKWAMVSSITTSDFDDLRMGSKGPEEYLRNYYVIRTDSVDHIVTNEDPLLQKPSGYSQINMMQKFRFKPNEKWDFQYGFHYSETSAYSRYDRHIRYKNGLPRYGEWYYGPQIWMMNNLSILNTSSNFLYDQIILRLAQQYFEESRISRDLNKASRERRIENVEAYSVNLDLNKNLGKKNEILYGVELVYNDVISKGFNDDIISGTTVAGPSRYPQANWLSYAAFITDKYKISNKFILQGGIRYNQYKIDAVFDTSFYPFPFTSAHLNNGALTGSLGAIYHPSEQLGITTNISTAFRSPNVDDLGKVFDSEPGSVVVPNPNLEAEYAYNADLGLVKIFGNDLKIDLTGYITYLDNALVRRDFTINGLDSIMYDGSMSKVQAVQNASYALIYGVQAGMDIKLSGGFEISSDFNYQKGTEELDDGTISPSRHAPPAYGTSRLTYTRNKLKMELNATYSGKVLFENLPEEEKGKPEIYAIDENGNPWSPSWYTLNYKVMYAISEHVTISSGLENITDQRYRPYSSGIVAPGRNFILSVRASF